MGKTTGGDAFTIANALSTLLTTESLLFAAFSLAVNLSGPSTRVRAWLIPVGYLAGAAVGALVVVAAGAGVAWERIFVTPGFPSDGSLRAIACALIVAIAVQPLLALLLALGLRSRG